MRPARPKNLATKTVAWPWASAVSIHCKQGRKIQASLQPFRRTRQPLQLIPGLDVYNHQTKPKMGGSSFVYKQNRIHTKINNEGGGRFL